MHLIFSQLSLIFTFSDSLQVLKSLLMSGRVSGVLDEGDSAGVPQDSFFQRHVLKCDAYITYCMHACTQF